MLDVDVISPAHKKPLSEHGCIASQVLLLVGGGQLARSLPILAVVYGSMLLAWTGAVARLDKLHVVNFSSNGGRAETGQQAIELRHQPGGSKAA